MSNHTKKGYRAIRAKDPKTGRVFTAAIPVGGRADKSLRRRQQRVTKAQRARFSEFKRQLREAKKNVPIELRSTVNWNAVSRETQSCV